MSFVYNMAVTPVKNYACETCVCCTCNNNIVFKNHPIDIFGEKAKEKGITAFLQTIHGSEISIDDKYPSRLCRKCYGKIIGFQEFVAMVKQSKRQQESVIQAKRGNAGGASPSIVFSPDSRRERKKSKTEAAQSNTKPATRVRLFPTGNALPARQLRTILPATPAEEAVDDLSVPRGKQRKLPPGIAAVDKMQPAKSVHILSNSGLRNPALVIKYCREAHRDCISVEMSFAIFSLMSPALVDNKIFFF